MQRFDTKQILERLIQRARINTEWNSIIEQGSIGSLFSAISESFQEVSRYLEYSLQEKKWKTARNLSSITTMTDLIGYKRGRPISQMGYVVVSHTDPLNNQRLPNFGASFFTLDSQSDYDDLFQKKYPTFMEEHSLIPWMNDTPYLIPKGTIFKSDKGVPFFSTSDVFSRPLKEAFSVIKNSPEKYGDFIRQGGWEGIKYVRVPVIQGELSTIDFGKAKGTRFETFTIEDTNVEAASNSISKEFFKVYVTPPGMTEEQQVEWQEIENIRLASPYEQVFETKISQKNEVLLIFGDGISGLQIAPGSRVRCQYVKTMGKEGNIPEKFQISNMQFPLNNPMIDPRTGEQNSFLQCLNTVSIMGGKNIEDIDIIKQVAPSSYLKSYTTSTIDVYKTQIEKNQPLNILKLKVYSDDVIKKASYPQTDRSLISEIGYSNKQIIITAIRANGDKIKDPNKNFLYPVVRQLQDTKSPTDTFEFVQPNFIKIRPSILIGSSDNILESDIGQKVKTDVLREFSIFQTDLGEPYHKSGITKLAKSQKFSNYEQTFIEAIADVNYTPKLVSNDMNNLLNRDAFLKYYFKFDKIFQQNRLNLGFKNFHDRQNYLLRVDVKFKLDPKRNRTFFLFDNRLNLQDLKTLKEAQQLPITNATPAPAFKIANDSDEDLSFVDGSSDYYENLQVRTAQFPYIDKITSPKYMSRLLDFRYNPTESRQLITDQTGNNKKFKANEISESLRVSLNKSQYTSGDECYQKNMSYWHNTKIIFTENYDNPTQQDYASGQFICPVEYILNEGERADLITLYEKQDASKYAEGIRNKLDSIFEINVYAQPRSDSFYCLNKNDIIFTPVNEILVEKEIDYSETSSLE